MIFFTETPPHQSALEVSPAIVQPSDTSRLGEAVQSWQHAGVVIESDADLHTVVDHLKSLISVRLPDQTFAYLRFYSPGQIGALFSAFTPDESVRFSGPVSRWHHFDSDHGWRTIEVSSLMQDASASEEGWFQLTKEHIRAIEAYNEAEFITELVRNADLPFTPENKSFIEALVEQGRSYGFRTQRDLASFTEVAAYYRHSIREPDALGILGDTERSARQRLAEIDNLMAQGGA